MYLETPAKHGQCLKHPGALATSHPSASRTEGPHVGQHSPAPRWWVRVGDGKRPFKAGEAYWERAGTLVKEYPCDAKDVHCQPCKETTGYRWRRHFWMVRGTMRLWAALPLEVQTLREIAHLASLGEHSRTSEGGSGMRLGWPGSSLAEGFRAGERGPPETPGSKQGFSGQPLAQRQALALSLFPGSPHRESEWGRQISVPLLAPPSAS